MSDDLYPVEVTIENFYCFRGKHTLKLGPKVYAVLAQAEDNPARSNWLGKSSLLAAASVFVLFGWHTKRTDEEIITRGEESASVSAVLSDGTKISRSKSRGKSMQIRLTPAGKRTITQAAAQAAIEEHIGFKEDDFFATCFFEQKQIGALVTAQSSKRIEMIEGWLAEELEPIQRLHGATVRELKAATDELNKLESESQDIGLDWLQLCEERMGDGPKDQALIQFLNEVIETTEESRKECKDELDALRKIVTTALTEARVWENKVAQAEEFGRIVERGLGLKASLDMLPEVSAELEVAKRKVTETGQRATACALKLQKLQAADYQFDGQCPVACLPCPSHAWVVKQATKGPALAKAKQEVAQTQTEVSKAKQEASALEVKRSRRVKVETEIERLRGKAEVLMDVADEVEEGFDGPSSDELEEQVETLEETIRTLETQLVKLRDDLDWATKAEKREQELRLLIQVAKHRVQVATEAVQITGRQGAQQTIQEIALAKVERRANGILSGAAIPLQVSVSWAQETKGLAKVCDKCGTAFPTSQRVKMCTVCGATRGPNTQRKLTIEPSDRSGAAEDLAGISMGIAASQWLRSVRGSRWGMACIDEPFGALDQHNRSALGAHIATMLSSAFSCALVVAHERGILATMPGRINIVAGPDGSRIEGVS